MSVNRIPEGVAWEVIVFDLDDTLYPESSFVLSGFRAIAWWCKEELQLNSDMVYRELVDIFESGVRGTIFDRWLAKHELPIGLLPKLVSVYRNHLPTIAPFEGVTEMLAQLRKGFRLGLLSDGFLPVQENKLTALGIRDQFDVVIFSDKWGRSAWKPSVQPFLELLGLLEVEPEKVVYVGDNASKDFGACSRLGMHSIWLRQPSGIYVDQQPPRESDPDYVVDSLRAVMQLLCRGDRRRYKEEGQ